MKEYKVQRYINQTWVSIDESFDTIEAAKKYANNLDIGDKPEPLRIVDEDGNVKGWVSRNGYMPGGARV